jgi:type I restriction enzyme S subunit
MKSNYDTLGKYIQPIDTRNSEGKEENLLGVTTQKYFMPSIANTVGTDFSKYKVVKRGQFTYVPDTSRRGDRIAIALLRDWDEGLVSNIYTVFEVVDRKKLLPEYLMLWFKRPEFDRYARFKSHGSVREIFDWDELRKVALPIPDIAVQRSIVGAFSTIEGRIKHLRALNDNLEATAQALFAERVLSAEDWDTAPLDKDISFVNGLAMQNFRPDEGESSLPVIKIRELNQGYCDGSSEYCIAEIGTANTIHTGDLVFSWSGSLMIDVWCDEKAGLNQHLFKVTSKKYPKWFCYLWVKNHLLNFQRIAENKGTTFGHIKREDLHNAEIVVPPKPELVAMDKVFEPLFSQRSENGIEILRLAKLQNLLLAKLSSGK